MIVEKLIKFDFKMQISVRFDPRIGMLYTKCEIKQEFEVYCMKNKLTFCLIVQLPVM